MRRELCEPTATEYRNYKLVDYAIKHIHMYFCGGKEREIKVFNRHLRENMARGYKVLAWKFEGQ